MKIKQIIQMLNDSEIVFSYSGLISQNILVQLANVAKKDVLTLETHTHKVNRIYEVIVEMLHNILSYSKNRYEIAAGVYESRGACLITRDEADDRYCIISVNIIDSSIKENIQSKLDRINALDKSSRKEFLKSQLAKDVKEGRRGAGLGFFEMSRRSSQKLDYEFFNIEGDEYFALKVTI